MTDLRAVAERIYALCFEKASPVGIETGRPLLQIESILREVVDATEVKWHTYYQHKLAENKFNEKQMDYAVSKAREEVLSRAAKVVTDYRSNGKYETGHGFMSDLDEIAAKIRALKP